VWLGGGKNAHRISVGKLEERSQFEDENGRE
jgi:hypothetical protein